MGNGYDSDEYVETSDIEERLELERYVPSSPQFIQKAAKSALNVFSTRPRKRIKVCGLINEFEAH